MYYEAVDPTHIQIAKRLFGELAPTPTNIRTPNSLTVIRMMHRLQYTLLVFLFFVSNYSTACCECAFPFSFFGGIWVVTFALYIQ